MIQVWWIWSPSPFFDALLFFFTEPVTIEETRQLKGRFVAPELKFCDIFVAARAAIVADRSSSHSLSWAQIMCPAIKFGVLRRFAQIRHSKHSAALPALKNCTFLENLAERGKPRFMKAISSSSMSPSNVIGLSNKKVSVSRMLTLFLFKNRYQYLTFSSPSVP